ncbi:hypothetical protein KIH74_09030 [Kineosporia sp. J2-2]|uniref:Tetrapyrrole methylase domain-containing protein n=1 Tax=Kineosporia corallincola TaxID=2835133 RepID=A0ABS5TDB0_9ACTN|nr:SAM-dependent methyltransferase [Kineosporia corallincola]MBT0769067.1 hypothetical protein [Kineosporia corallincola]
MIAGAQLPCDIAVVGLGIAGVHHLTKEVEETIRRCTKTFVADTGTGMLEYLGGLGTEVVDLTQPREVGEHRILIYRRIAAEVVAAAKAGGPVCFATYGHPTMYCYPTTLIQRAALVLNLSVTVLPGVSFLDTLLCDLGVDPGFDGLQMYEASDLVVRRRPLQADVPCVITQAPMTLDAYNRRGSRALDNLRLLQRHLLGTYPADHEVLLVTSKPHPLLEPLIQPVPLGSLAAALLPATQLGTLFIPALHRREIADRELAARMQILDGPRTARVTSGAPPSRPGRPPIGPQPA